jgi:hypothetical protein
LLEAGETPEKFAVFVPFGPFALKILTKWYYQPAPMTALGAWLSWEIFPH